MEKRIRKFERQYAFNKKSFKLQIDLDQINGMSDVWMYEVLDVPFVFSLTERGVHRDDLFVLISNMEDRAHEFSLKNDLYLIVSTISDKGFHEIFEEGEEDIVETEINEMEG